MKDLNLSQEIINKFQKAIEMSSNKIGPERIAAETGLRLNLVREFINYPERFLKDAVELKQPENYIIDIHEALYRHIYGIRKEDSVNLPNDYKETVDWLLDPANKKLPERCAVILRLYYLEDYTVDELAKRYHVTNARITQIINKGLRLLRNPVNNKYLIYGIEYMNIVDAKVSEAKKEIMAAHIEKINKEKQDRIDNIKSRTGSGFDVYGNVSLEEMELSIRTYNCLRRYGIKHVSDFENKTYLDLLKIRNLGKVSMKELLVKLESYGITIPFEEE